MATLPYPATGLTAAESAHLAARRTVPIPRRPPPRGRSGAPLPLAAAVAVGWAALVSFVPVLVLVVAAQTAAGAPSVGGAFRTAAAGWLLAHGVPVQTPIGPVGLVPLALTAFVAWRTVRAGVHVTRATGARRRRSPRQALLVAGAVGSGYGVVGVVLAAVAGGPGWGPSVLRAGLTLTGFGFVAAGWGALRTTGVAAAWRARLPPVLRAGLRAGLAAALGLVGVGAALAGVAIAADGGAAAESIGAYRTGVDGQAGVILLCLAYAPNLAIWAVAYLVGPGFAVGAGTTVRSSEVMLGDLPVLPVFAGLPDGPLPTAGALLLVVPVVAGALAGLPLRRVAPGVGRLALAAGVAGLAAAAAVGLAAAASAGPLGDGQLAALGPAPWLVAGWSAAFVTLGLALGAGVAAVVARRHRAGPVRHPPRVGRRTAGSGG